MIIIEIIKEKTCCFTGHRYIKDVELCRTLLEVEIENIIESGFNTFVFGGAFGFDLLAMDVLYSSFIKHDDALNMVLVLPCRIEEQTRNWKNKRDIEFLRLCVNEIAKKVIYISEHYYDGCLKERNAKMVELSSFCICYMEREQSGTGQTVRMARRKGLEIINIRDKILTGG